MEPVKIMFFIPLLLVGILIPAIQTKEVTKPELCKVLKVLDGYQGLTLPEWICIIFHMSGCDTQTIVKYNGNTAYGLFQINNKFWCRDDQFPQSRNICNISCDKFLDDDFTDDIMCVKKILDSEGVGYWPAYKPLCSEKLEQWRCEES
ncbi:PREDICTED: alpha-lactalbumin [Chrysochloris asiatica]|uniref:Lactose synthase B protein n=1 Tax=Chrysochloris asiatica TaxID=185453 RepID=A0A9B0X2V8_CHRAS|nr:PREDICTED: alpha-lactalbumin [Chrysochloris asiatica]